MFRLFNQWRNHICLSPFLNLMFYKIENLFHFLLANPRRLDGLAPTRNLTQDRSIHFPKSRNRQRTRNWRRGHLKHVHARSFSRECLTLLHPETMLLVDNDKGQVFKVHILLEQGMCPDNEVCLTTFNLCEQLFSLLLRTIHTSR